MGHACHPLPPHLRRRTQSSRSAHRDGREGRALLPLRPTATRPCSTIHIASDCPRPDPHLAFSGGGPHFAWARTLARMEMRIMFDELFMRLPDLELTGEPDIMHSMFFNGVKSMPCAFTPTPRASRR